MRIEFIKMHGCGNDFVIIDNRSGQYSLKSAQVKFLADRKIGVGFDQLILLDLSSDAAVSMKIYNADGSPAGMCGNALRCVAGIILDDTGENETMIESPSGIARAKLIADEEVSVDIGVALFNPSLIPIKNSLDPLAIDMKIPGLPKAIALSVGNPHLVFFLDKDQAFDINILGSQFENHEYFPDRINVSFARMIDENNINLAVWERGAGRTLACGSAACATVAAAVKLGLYPANQQVSVHMDGGILGINVSDNFEITMSGPYKMVYKGTIEI